jgi:hypothetical protein
MIECTKERYEAAIPACCEYQGLKAHMGGLMLCWGLVAAVEAGRAMDCRGCELRTRPIFFERELAEVNGEPANG